MTLGLKRGTVKREPHDKQGNEIAVQTIKTLKSILGDDAVDIQHIGSTAISVIKAKPIIDIVWCQNINSTSQNEKFQIHISMIQQRHAEGGSHMAKQHDKQFKLDAVQYYQDHKDLGVRGCAENLGIGYSTLTKWLKDFRESGDIPVRGSGNYASDEQKEIARLRRELRDAQDALDVLKKAINILGK